MCSPAVAVSLQDLLNGDSLVVNNCRLSDWQLVLMDATSGVPPNLTLVNVTPLAATLSNPGVQFDTLNQFAVSGLNALDLILQFHVTPLPGGKSFTGHSLTFVTLGFGGEGGTALISQEVTDHTMADLGPVLVMADNQSDIFVLDDDSSFAPRSSLSVTLNLFEQGFSGPDSINATTFRTRFLQDGSMVLAGDYNDDGIVNLADYSVWRDHLGGPAGALANNVDGGPIDADHYVTWKTYLGNTIPASALLGSANVPEPDTIALGLLAACHASVLTLRRARHPYRPDVGAVKPYFGAIGFAYRGSRTYERLRLYAFTRRSIANAGGTSTS